MQNVLQVKKGLKLILTKGILSSFAPNFRYSSKRVIPTANFSSLPKNETNCLHRLTIIGGGHMGTGIAQVSAAAGNVVTVADAQEEALRKSKAKIEERLFRHGKKTLKGEELSSYIQAVMNRLKFSTDIPKSVENSDMVLEAITEQLDKKHSLFSILDQAAPPSAIFVTNTSSIPVEEIAVRLSSTRQERFGGVHFFNAVVMKLVEVIRTTKTSDESFINIMNWSKFIGKVPLSCKDTPGFIVNRLNIPYSLDAIAMYERGDATPKDIDLAMKFGAGYVYGPFEIMDYIGLDVLYFIFQGWEKRFPDRPCPETIKQKYKEGKWGLKTGEGFFKYPSKQI